jgi:hypothetical protein
MLDRRTPNFVFPSLRDRVAIITGAGQGLGNTARGIFKASWKWDRPAAEPVTMPMHRVGNRGRRTTRMLGSEGSGRVLVLANERATSPRHWNRMQRCGIRVKVRQEPSSVSLRQP